MKTQVYILIILLYMFGMQTTTAQTWDWGGNTISGSGDYIGTNNNQPFTIYTNAGGIGGGERMRINANGNIGIGTAFPITTKFQVHDDGFVNTFIRVTNGTTGLFNGLSLGVDTSGNSRIVSNGTAPLLIFRGTIERMRFATNGNIGIGQSGNYTPKSQLHLHADVTRNYIQIATINADTGVLDGLKIGVNEDASTGNMPNAEIRQQEDAHMSFFTNNTERIKVFNTGETALHVVNNDNSQNRFLVWDYTDNDKIKYRDISSLPFVSNCSTTTSNYLTKWCTTGIQIRNSQVFDNGTNVGIGTAIPVAKLDINNNTSVTGIRTITTSSSLLFSYGSFSQSYSGSSIFNIGNYGGAFNVTGSNILNLGIVGIADGNNQFNIGGAFTAGFDHCLPGVTNYGIWATAARRLVNDKCESPIAGYFNGYIAAQGGIFNGSDATLKDSIQNITQALNIVSRLHPKSFNYKTDTYPYMGLPEHVSYGLIAQETDTVLPDIVTVLLEPARYDTSGTMIQDTFSYKAINYTGLIPFTIAAIQEQQQIIDSLAATKANAQPQPADTNRVVKWNQAANMLSSSLLYDNGTAVGMPTVKPGSYFNVANTTDTIAATFSSNATGAVAVVHAEFTGDSSDNDVPAVRGTSIYTRESIYSGGKGGFFVGGEMGAAGRAIGNNEFEVGMYGEAEGARLINAGVLGTAGYETDSINIGVFGSAEVAGYINGGVVALSDVANNTSINYGIYAEAGYSTHENFAGYFRTRDTIGITYAVYAKSEGNAPNHYAGYYDGDVHISGRLTGGSDAMLKDNIQQINKKTALQQINQLKPSQYRFKTSSYPTLSLPTGVQYGFIAQEVETVFPHLVKTINHPEVRDMKGGTVNNKFSYKGLDYIGLIPVLVAALQEQTAKSDSLQDIIDKRIAALEAKLEQCCRPVNQNTSYDNSNAYKTSVELSSVQVVLLQQNVPNPFAEQTSISYYVPETATKVQVIFTDQLGHVIKTSDVKPGYGTLVVYAADLSNGQYTYSLVVDGRVLATKKMMKQ